MTGVPIDLEFRLLNDWQRDFPLVPRPYAQIADRLGSTEALVIETLADLRQRGHVSRVGAVFRPHVLGSSTLAALACPADRLEEVARLVSAYPEVNHNYEREHTYNLWFVVVAATSKRVAEVLAEIRARTGLDPLDLPMLTDYHIDLGFDLYDRRAPRRPHLHPAGSPVLAAVLRQRLDEDDHALASALADGLELVPRPYASLAARCGMSEEVCLGRLKRLIELSVIRRLGVVVRHRELGYAANAMVVWDIPDARVDEIGRQLANEAGVSLCYRRMRRPPQWPYNLFSMLHGRDRVGVLEQVERLRMRVAQAMNLQDPICLPLFSRRRFKQCGARYVGLARAA